MQRVKIAQSLETLLLHFLGWVATPCVSLISRQRREMILSTARLDMAADVAGRAVSLGWWTFHPHLCFHLGNLCALTKQACASSLQWWETQNTETLIPPCLRGFVSICLFVFYRNWFCGVAVSACVTVRSYWKHQLTVNLLLPFLWHNSGAVSFILGLPLHACLVNGVFAIDLVGKVPLFILFHHVRTCVAT